jgi:2Fe-2S ferredoxin
MQKDDSTEVTNWVEVTFVLPDGSARQCRGELGETLMDVALDNLVPGIFAQCGGGCTCCTCHVYIDNRWFVQLPEPHPDELELLTYALEVGANSRLSCQVVLDPNLQGCVITVPRAQA